jgi:hypothetical protein
MFGPTWDAQLTADVLNMSDLITFGESSIMHGTRIPENEITGLHVHLVHGAASLLKPLDVLLAEDEQVHILDLRRRSILMISRVALLSKELIEKLGRALHEHETTILGAVGGKVQETLHSLHALGSG